MSGPMLLAARASRVPGALLEVDAHVGLANRLAAPLVERVYLSFPIEGRTGGKYLVTGRPVPAEPADAGETWTGDVFAFGGSLGATRLNAAVAPWAGGDLRVLHVTGDREYEPYRDLEGERYRVRAFLPGLHAALRGASLVVARAGGSIFEIAAAGKPSILIPSPNVTADHQTANARHLEQAGPAIVIPDAELTHERLDVEVRALLADPERLRRMGEARPRLGAAGRGGRDRRRPPYTPRGDELHRPPLPHDRHRRGRSLGPGDRRLRLGRRGDGM